MRELQVRIASADEDDADGFLFAQSRDASIGGLIGLSRLLVWNLDRGLSKRVGGRNGRGRS